MIGCSRQTISSALLAANGSINPNLPAACRTKSIAHTQSSLSINAALVFKAVHAYPKSTPSASSISRIHTSIRTLKSSVDGVGQSVALENPESATPYALAFLHTKSQPVCETRNTDVEPGASSKKLEPLDCPPSWTRWFRTA